MKRKINNDTANESSKRAEDIIDEQTSESSALNSSIDANSSQDQSSSLKEEGSSRRKRGRPKRTDAVTLPSTSESITQSSTAVENEKQALEETTIDVDSENVINTDGNDSTMTNCESTDPQTQPNRSADADASITPVPSTNRRSKRRVRSTVVVEDREPEQEELKTNMDNGSVNNTNASNASSSDSGPTESPTAPLTSRNARPKRKKVSNEKDSSMFELVCTKVVDDEEDAETDIVVDDDMDDIVLRSPRSKGKNGTSRSETSVVVVEPLRDALINSVKLTEDDLIKNDGSVEDFTQKTKFRTAQIIVCGRILYVNPFALIEYSDIVANVFEQSGRNCKIQLDFLDFDELQTALRIFCRSPVTGLKERLNDPNCKIFYQLLHRIYENFAVLILHIIVFILTVYYVK
ncbi:unnamed protein product [Anisakis simplex]|uniref:BTB domain-containing protein n=1 Tax=Anisakis simplex TaxID=6269 RepID=A0A0M3K3W9_ANISI|nr:unnamed protein product [Anisakis simplex]